MGVPFELEGPESEDVTGKEGSESSKCFAKLRGLGDVEPDNDVLGLPDVCAPGLW